MHNKDRQFLNRKHTAWQQEGKMYNPLLDVVLPASGDLSRDSLLLSGAGELIPEGDDSAETKLPLVKGSLGARHCPKPLSQMLHLVPLYR